MKKLKLMLAVMFAIAVGNASAQQLKPFKAGDRVAFVGNSITDGGHYHSYIWLYYMTRFPEMRVWMGNLGIGGDTSAEILNRIEGDAYAKLPTVLALTFGMNDSGYQELNSDTAATFANHRVDFARNNYEKIEKHLLNHPEARVIQIGTSPYDQNSKIKNTWLWKGKNDVIKRIIDLQRSSAKRNGWEFFDFNEPMVALNTLIQQRDSAEFTICGHDRIHPDNDGHMYMAYLFLKAQGMGGKKVADMQINAKKKVATLTDNCSISNISGDKTSLSFDYLAKSLPYPLDTIARGAMEWKRPQCLVLKYVPDFMKEMNDENLTVTGLKGTFELKIDNEVIDTLSAEDLAKGVNLATYVNTPQYKQALRVMDLNEDRWDMERRVRDWAWVEFDYFLKNGVKDFNTDAAVKMYNHDKQNNWWLASRRDIFFKMRNPGVREACEKYQQTVVDEIYRVNKPVSHHISINRLQHNK